MKILAAIFIIAAAVLYASSNALECAPVGPSADDGPLPPAFAGADYNGEGQEWIAEHGDGPVLGYAATGDSTIYPERKCIK